MSGDQLEACLNEHAFTARAEKNRPAVAVAVTRKSRHRAMGTAGKRVKGGDADVAVGAAPQSGACGVQIPTGALIGPWCATSIAFNQTTTLLLTAGACDGAPGLALLQMAISAAIGGASLFGLRLTECTALPNREAACDTAVLGALVTAGIGMLDACIGLMHVTLALVLCATEPAFVLQCSHTASCQPRNCPRRPKRPRSSPSSWVRPSAQPARTRPRPSSLRSHLSAMAAPPCAASRASG